MHVNRKETFYAYCSFSIVTNKYVSQVLYCNIIMYFEKVLGSQVFKNHNCNPFQSSSSLSIRASFCICCVIYTLYLLFIGFE